MTQYRGQALAINGRFLAAKPTAVHLVAEELTRALLNDDSESDDDLLFAPTSARSIEGVPESKVSRVGNQGSILWEQFTFPRASKGRSIVSFCNKTTLFSPNAYTMIHDAQVFTQPESYPLPVRHWGRLHAKVSGRFQQGILTVSETSKQALLKAVNCPADHIHVIHCGVDHVHRDVPDYQILDRLKLQNRPYVLALANTQPHKNIGTLLKAFQDPSLSEVTLVLTGHASAQDFEQLGHTVANNVLFTGFVSDGEMRALQKQALCVCMPSLSEGFGLPPLEAMALGTPAIVAPCGSLPEVCGEAAIFADENDPLAWSKAILSLYGSNSLRNRQVDLGLDQAGRYTWETAAKKVRQAIVGKNIRGPK